MTPHGLQHASPHLCCTTQPLAHRNGSDTPSPQTAQAGLLLCGQVQQLHHVTRGKQHQVLGQHGKVGALLTLVTEGVTGGGQGSPQP